MLALGINLPQRGILWALACSLLLHLATILMPAWQLPSLFDLFPTDTVTLEAHLIRTPSARNVPRSAPHRPQAVASNAPVDATSGDSAGLPSRAAESIPEPTPERPPDTEFLPVVIPDIASPLPRRGRIVFSVVNGEGGFVAGRTTHEWQHDNSNYTLTGTTETTGILALLHPGKVVQSSAGVFSKGDLLPHEFRVDRGDGEIETASFDWDRLKVVLNGRQEVSIAGGAEDLLSMFYQLTQAAQQGEGFQMAVATGRKLETYSFEWLDEEDVVVKAGRFRAWHVRVKAASGGKDTVEVWLGQKVAGLPVKIRQTDRKGNVIDLVAEEINYEGK